MKEEIYKKFFRYLDQRVNGIGGDPYQDGYRHDFLKIFKESFERNIRVKGDAIWDWVDKHEYEKLKNPEFKKWLGRLCRTWDDYWFLKENYDEV
ncbi:MAG: hypothetical protein H7A32_01125 [Deltaproteobacteria bacterium]|nr:hypothetical protein [Deltaproteobacteria bacterium]